MNRDNASLFLLSFIASRLLVACGTPSPANDAAADSNTDAVTDIAADRGDAHLCTSDLECTDSLFCNGVERCMPSAPGSDARGCIAASPATACTAGQVCDEAMTRCLTMCTGTPDADGDGHNSVACGGDDCDDADPQRFPGNPEVCTFVATGSGAAHRPGGDHDEDCNANTIASASPSDGDHDGDGYIDANCSNTDSSGAVHRGDDCNDADPVTVTIGSSSVVVSPGDIHPSQSEACNGVDDNCDGRIDDGVMRAFFPDADHDNYGLVGSDPIYACRPPPDAAENASDCDDTNAQIHPGALESCNGADDDCNGMIDDGSGPGLLCAAMYGSPSHTVFACAAGACTTTCTGTWGDCDGQLNTGCETDLSNTVDHCGSCSTNCGAGGLCSPSMTGTGPAGTCDHVTLIRAGNGSTCAARSGGTTVCWGLNDHAQLGDGTAISRSTAAPVRLVGAASEVQLSRFAPHAFPSITPCDFGCALSGPNMQCWGCNTSGQLGNGSMTSAPVPVYVTNYPPATSIDVLFAQPPQISNGYMHTCGAHALHLETAFPDYFGVVSCWGSNSLGELGVAPPPNTFSTPRDAWTVVGADRMRVGAGAFFTCAVAIQRGMAGAPVFCWGGGFYGQMGNGTTNSRTPTPTQVSTITDAVDVAAGYRHACAIRANGTVWCWGDNYAGQLGDGTTVMRTTPVQAIGVSNAVQLALGTTHSCARLSTGAVTCWGEAPPGDGSGSSLTPVAATGISDAIDLSVGDLYSCVLRADHSAWCWGVNGYGQLGTGTTTSSNVPVRATIVTP